NGVDFSVQLAGNTPANPWGDDDTNVFMKRMKQKDVWGASFDAGPSGSSRASGDLGEIKFPGFNTKTEEDEANKEPLYKQYRIALINTSPGGYCLQWLGEIPANLQAGEILGV